MIRFALASLIALHVGGAAAGGFDGRYVAGDRRYQQELIIKKRAEGGYAIDASVGAPGCAGGAEAAGQAVGDVLTASAKHDNQNCVLTITRAGKRLRVNEENCLYFHGAACEFSGDYRKR